MVPDATHTQRQAKGQLALPVLVFGIVEVRRLRRELEAVDDYIRQVSLREPGKQPSAPRVSRLLDALATDNNRNLLQDADRRELEQFLGTIEHSAPTVHVSFASDPSSSFMAKLVTWLRGNIHPAVLVQVGLQPTIAAGCIVRTPNKSFDFSLRHHLDEQRPVLIKALEQDWAAHASLSRQAQPQPVVAAPQSAAPAVATAPLSVAVAPAPQLAPPEASQA